jgi:hypothetical protein
LRPLWETDGHWDEGRRWLAATLALEVESPERARAVVVAATLASRQPDHEAAAELAREASSQARETGDPDVAVRALNVLAVSAKEMGDTAAAKRHDAELISLAESAGEEDSLIVAYLNLADVALK